MNGKTHSSGRRDRAVRQLARFGHAGLLVAVLAASIWFFNGEGRWSSFAAPVEQAAADESAPADVSRTHAIVAASDAKPAKSAKQLSREMAQARNWLSRRYRVSKVAIEPALRAAEDSGRRLGVDPMLLVAMIAIESSFNPYAESNVGAQGLMQVIPRFHMDKIGKGKGKDALFDPELNVRVGAQVLKEGLRRYGTLEAALQYYGGALNDPDAAYANKVLTMKQRIATAARAGGGAV
ncbi:MAG: lytic transglycosylase domain-containing protein [Azoarcus sp.]|jgi:soluble lytic murein transglycosylase-like protein|nr:lytic transglycosylase domain-containing protein [Azoarcus sp.]